MSTIKNTDTLTTDVFDYNQLPEDIRSDPDHGAIYFVPKAVTDLYEQANTQYEKLGANANLNTYRLILLAAIELEAEYIRQNDLIEFFAAKKGPAAPTMFRHITNWLQPTGLVVRYTFTNVKFGGSKGRAPKLTALRPITEFNPNAVARLPSRTDSIKHTLAQKELMSQSGQGELVLQMPIEAYRSAIDTQLLSKVARWSDKESDPKLSWAGKFAGSHIDVTAHAGPDRGLWTLSDIGEGQLIISTVVANLVKQWVKGNHLITASYEEMISHAQNDITLYLGDLCQFAGIENRSENRKKIYQKLHRLAGTYVTINSEKGSVFSEKYLKNGTTGEGTYLVDFLAYTECPVKSGDGRVINEKGEVIEPAEDNYLWVNFGLNKRTWSEVTAKAYNVWKQLRGGTLTAEEIARPNLFVADFDSLKRVDKTWNYYLNHLISQSLFLKTDKWGMSMMEQRCLWFPGAKRWDHFREKMFRMFNDFIPQGETPISASTESFRIIVGRFIITGQRMSKKWREEEDKAQRDRHPDWLPLARKECHYLQIEVNTAWEDPTKRRKSAEIADGYMPNELLLTPTSPDDPGDVRPRDETGKPIDNVPINTELLSPDDDDIAVKNAQILRNRSE